MTSHLRILAWKNPMDRRAWQATVHGTAEHLSAYHFLLLLGNNRIVAKVTLTLLPMKIVSKIIEKL